MDESIPTHQLYVYVYKAIKFVFALQWYLYLHKSSCTCSIVTSATESNV